MASSNSSPREWVTSLINAIPPGINASQTPNPLRDLPPQGKNVLLTLYALFEKEVLPALDLLDRGLVSRLTLDSPAGPQAQVSHLYIVHSAQQQNTRVSTHDYVNNYEVRLAAWNCSCPAFALSAFPASASEASDPPSTEEQIRQSQWLVGGLTLGEDIPICKHLLACLLIEHCSAFAHFVQEKQVTLDEIAGWSAGWGD
ncbi:hypothetical protein CERZMDRAFT_71859 [Cercospora zeae-maydis SCOH1-5]|uniref:SWIM-type domain-containing protein n=1 Tax=Cercospora zeae-maydis SCOH1-5 TaxID=717836 RepID=A0A6A6EXM3_9PEZI|nr:hypothetical protein CERZMDRAFT_71859 [Cercospora zeae-maydis SCOH1-5]